MRWDLKEPNKVGDKRLNLKFAWFPIKVEKKKIWLESYWLAEEFSVVNPMGNTHPGSSRRYEAWVVKSKHLKENKPKPKTQKKSGKSWSEI